MGVLEGKREENREVANSKIQRRYRDNLQLLVGMQTGAPTMKDTMQVPPEVRNRNTIESRSPGSLPKENEDADLERYMQPSVHSF